MFYELTKHVRKLPVNFINEAVEATPQVAYSEQEVQALLIDLQMAVDVGTYVPQTPTLENPALSDDYVFDTGDENAILKDLTKEHFVGKVLDVGKGAKRRIAKGYPQEYLYIFKYPCVLWKREAESEESTENVLIYIKINNRKVPNEKVCIVSFHKNRTKTDKEVNIR